MKKIYVMLIVTLFIVSSTPVVPIQQPSIYSKNVLSQMPDDSNIVPLSKVVIVKNNPNNYIDDFSYIAAVPTSVFLYNGKQYISPVVYSDNIDSAKWLMSDWGHYLSQDSTEIRATAIGEISFEERQAAQYYLHAKVFPTIIGDTSAEIAAKLAINDWETTSHAVLALSKDNFNALQTTTGTFQYKFTSAEERNITFSGSVTEGGSHTNSFTTTANDGWIFGYVNWSKGSTTPGPILTHLLVDPAGNKVDYSFLERVYFERNPAYSGSVMPLYFWFPNTIPGTWNLTVYGKYNLAGTVSYQGLVHFWPGKSFEIDVPSNAKFLNVSTYWERTSKNIDIFLVDPDGHVGEWGVGKNLLTGAQESLYVPYPKAGKWRVCVIWEEPDGSDLDGTISYKIQTFDGDIPKYMESAANGAVIASLTNSPLLYINKDSIPSDTIDALQKMSVSNVEIVDPHGLVDSSVISQLQSAGYTVTHIQDYSSLVSRIQTLSSDDDVVVVPVLGNCSSLFSSAALSGAFHGAPVFSLSGEDQTLTTRIEGAWSPFKIGPEINIYVTTQYATRNENGWIDERIPNIYMMARLEISFESWLTNHSARTGTIQSIIIFGPTDLIKTTFDRAIIGPYRPGRISGKTAAMDAIFVSRAILHRFLATVSADKDTAFLTMYAYDYGTIVPNNYGTSEQIFERQLIRSAMINAGFTISEHIGKDAVIAALNAQPAHWSISTHGTLTETPTDPPMRPDGPGVMSLRDEDAPYGFESNATNPDSNNDHLVNPVIDQDELSKHVTLTGQELDAALENIGSTIVSFTACLIGGTEIPYILMKHSAVGVIASPRTVYFRPAGYLAVIFARSIAAGNTTGEALRQGILYTSATYGHTIKYLDYANQHYLSGDPEIKLYKPSELTHIPAVDPNALDLAGHKPNSGLPSIAVIGGDGTLTHTLTLLGLSYDYFDSTNITDYINNLLLYPTTVFATGSINQFNTILTQNSARLNYYLTGGGVIELIGVNQTVTWLSISPEVVEQAGTTFTIADSQHPLVSSPNTLSPVSYQFAFSNIPANITIIGKDNNNVVWIAGVVGLGKLSMMTLNIDGNQDYVENLVSWYNKPSIILQELIYSEEIIWSGDVFHITFKLTDLYGNPVTNANLTAWLNNTAIKITDSGNGTYILNFDSAWTQSHVGYTSFRITASKNGYDTLTLSLPSIYIRSLGFGILMIGLAVGVIVLFVIVSWAIGKRGKGSKSKSKKTAKEKKSETTDVRDILGV